MLQGTIILLADQSFGFESRSTMDGKPQAIRHVWQLEGLRTSGYSYCAATDAIGKPATCRDGRVSCYLGNGNSVNGALIGGGGSQAIILEITEVPAPKVKAGIETRWHNGSWQKLLRKGWVPA